VIADQAGVVPGRRVKLVVSGGYGPNETEENGGIMTAQNARGKQASPTGSLFRAFSKLSPEISVTEISAN